MGSCRSTRRGVAPRRRTAAAVEDDLRLQHRCERLLDEEFVAMASVEGSRERVLPRRARLDEHRRDTHLGETTRLRPPRRNRRPPRRWPLASCRHTDRLHRRNPEPRRPRNPYANPATPRPPPHHPPNPPRRRRHRTRQQRAPTPLATRRTRPRDPLATTRDYGTTWLEERRSLILEVPSIVMPLERTYLIDPAHSRFGEVRVTYQQIVTLDPRLRR